MKDTKEITEKIIENIIELYCCRKQLENSEKYHYADRQNFDENVEKIREALNTTKE